MTTPAEPPPVSTSVLWTVRFLSGLVVLFLPVDGAVKLMPLQVVTYTLDRMGHGSGKLFARGLCLSAIACTVLFAVPPASILLTGYLGGAMASHVRIDSPLFTDILFGLYLGLVIWGGLWLRSRTVRALIPFWQ